jgi:predicted ATPase
MNPFVTLSGCSGGGKSTLLAELARRGYATVEEPGRRIVRQELAENGSALPWIDAGAFLRRAIAMALADREAAAGHQGWVFFDRGLIDALSGEPWARWRISRRSRARTDTIAASFSPRRGPRFTRPIRSDPTRWPRRCPNMSGC